MQFMMLYVKKLLLEFRKKNEAKNSVHFEEDLFFLNNAFSMFRIVRPKGKFTKAKK